MSPINGIERITKLSTIIKKISKFLETTFVSANLNYH